MLFQLELKKKTDANFRDTKIRKLCSEMHPQKILRIETGRVITITIRKCNKISVLLLKETTEKILPVTQTFL